MPSWCPKSSEADALSNFPHQQWGGVLVEVVIVSLSMGGYRGLTLCGCLNGRESLGPVLLLEFPEFKYLVRVPHHVPFMRQAAGLDAVPQNRLKLI